MKAQEDSTILWRSKAFQLNPLVWYAMMYRLGEVKNHVRNNRPSYSK